MEASFYDNATLAERREWLTRENMRRVEEAARRRAAEPAEPIDFDFAVLEDAPKAEPVEFEFNPPTR